MILNEKTKFLNDSTSTLSSIYDEIALLKDIKLSDLNNKTTALVVVDMINGFVHEGAFASKNIADIIPSVKSLMETCSNLNIPVVLLADSHTPNATEFNCFPTHCVQNTTESEIIDELKDVCEYTLIKKNSTNGALENKFQEQVMKHPNINTVIVVGNCTDVCVMQFCLTIKSMYNRINKKLDVILPINSVDTYNSDTHFNDLSNLMALEFMKNEDIKLVKGIIV